MKLSEKIYTAITIVLCGLSILAIANFYIYLIPRLEEASGQVFRFVGVVICFYAFALGITSLVNLRSKSLKATPTVIQIIILLLTLYGIPLAVWGVVLLKKRMVEEKRVTWERAG